MGSNYPASFFPSISYIPCLIPFSYPVSPIVYALNSISYSVLPTLSHLSIPTFPYMQYPLFCFPWPLFLPISIIRYPIHAICILYPLSGIPILYFLPLYLPFCIFYLVSPNLPLLYPIPLSIISYTVSSYFVSPMCPLSCIPYFLSLKHYLVSCILHPLSCIPHPDILYSLYI